MPAIPMSRQLRMLQGDWARVFSSLDELVRLSEQDLQRFRAEWCTFETFLRVLLAREERVVLSRLALVELRTSVAMQREHDLLRARLENVSAAAREQRTVTEDLNTLAAELRAHRAHEVFEP